MRVFYGYTHSPLDLEYIELNNFIDTSDTHVRYPAHPDIFYIGGDIYLKLKCISPATITIAVYHTIATDMRPVCTHIHNAQAQFVQCAHTIMYECKRDRHSHGK